MSWQLQEGVLGTLAQEEEVLPQCLRTSEVRAAQRGLDGHFPEARRADVELERKHRQQRLQDGWRSWSRRSFQHQAALSMGVTGLSHADNFCA